MKSLILILLFCLQSFGLNAQIETSFNDCLNKKQVKAIFKVIEIHDKFVRERFGGGQKPEQAWINYVDTAIISGDESKFFLPEKQLKKI